MAFNPELLEQFQSWLQPQAGDGVPTPTQLSIHELLQNPEAADTLKHISSYETFKRLLAKEDFIRTLVNPYHSNLLATLVAHDYPENILHLAAKVSKDNGKSLLILIRKLKEKYPAQEFLTLLNAESYHGYTPLLYLLDAAPSSRHVLNLDESLTFNLDQLIELGAKYYPQSHGFGVEPPTINPFHIAARNQDFRLCVYFGKKFGPGFSKVLWHSPGPVCIPNSQNQMEVQILSPNEILKKNPFPQLNRIPTEPEFLAAKVLGIQSILDEVETRMLDELQECKKRESQGSLFGTLVIALILTMICIPAMLMGLPPWLSPVLFIPSFVIAYFLGRDDPKQFVTCHQINIALNLSILFALSVNLNKVGAILLGLGTGVIATSAAFVSVFTISIIALQYMAFVLERLSHYILSIGSTISQRFGRYTGYRRPITPLSRMDIIRTPPWYYRSHIFFRQDRHLYIGPYRLTFFNVQFGLLKKILKLRAKAKRKISEDDKTLFESIDLRDRTGCLERTDYYANGMRMDEHDIVDYNRPNNIQENTEVLLGNINGFDTSRVWLKHYELTALEEIVSNPNLGEKQQVSAAAVVIEAFHNKDVAAQKIVDDKAPRVSRDDIPRSAIGGMLGN